MQCLCPPRKRSWESCDWLVWAPLTQRKRGMSECHLLTSRSSSVLKLMIANPSIISSSNECEELLRCLRAFARHFSLLEREGEPFGSSPLRASSARFCFSWLSWCALSLRFVRFRGLLCTVSIFYHQWSLTHTKINTSEPRDLQRDNPILRKYSLGINSADWSKIFRLR